MMRASVLESYLVKVVKVTRGVKELVARLLRQNKRLGSSSRCSNKQEACNYRDIPPMRTFDVLNS